MAKSFTITSYKGVTVSGTVIIDSLDSTLVLVEERLPPTPALLWIIDKLEAVGISLEAEQVFEMIPHLQKWAAAIRKESDAGQSV